MPGECNECPNEMVFLNILNGEDNLQSVLRFLYPAGSLLPFGLPCGNNYPRLHVNLNDCVRRKVGAGSRREFIKTSLC